MRREKCLWSTQRILREENKTSRGISTPIHDLYHVLNKRVSQSSEREVSNSNEPKSPYQVSVKIINQVNEKLTNQASMETKNQVSMSIFK
jgi:hypothetical protein